MTVGYSRAFRQYTMYYVIVASPHSLDEQNSQRLFANIVGKLNSSATDYYYLCGSKYNF